VPTVALVGTLDTKGEEYGLLKRRVEEAGCRVVLIDVGAIGEPTLSPEVSRATVLAAAGADLGALLAAGDRGALVTALGQGAGMILARMAAEQQIQAVAGMGGSGGTSVLGAAMQHLPIGFPKLIVSTMASGDTRPFVRGADITLMHSVVDIAGSNRILRRVLGNAALAIAGMARAEACGRPDAGVPVVAATMFGVTSPGVTAARHWLEYHGYEVLVFHANGAGGRAMESLMRQGQINGVLDVTTTELVDELVGGELSAGPQRLEVAGSIGLPQVVSLGALDIANFGPLDTVPERYRHRRLLVHNPAVTLMRTTPDECAQLGVVIAAKLNAALGPVTVFIPRRGTSALAVAGGPFHDPDADAALFGALCDALEPGIEVVDMDTDVNDPSFAEAMAECVNRLYRSWRPTGNQAAERDNHGVRSDGGGKHGDGSRRQPAPARRSVLIE
jgi:uncharacterized protein (UPF0261 family)